MMAQCLPVRYEASACDITDNRKQVVICIRWQDERFWFALTPESAKQLVVGINKSLETFATFEQNAN